MGLVNGIYNWGSVKALYFVVVSMNLAGMVALVLAILWAIRFERGFGDYLNLVAPGDGHVWTMVIISAAIFCSPAYFLGTKCWLHLKLESTRNDLDGQSDDTVDPQAVNRLLFFHVVLCLLSGFLVAMLNAAYFFLLSGFHQKSRDGLIEAIEKYGSDVAVKARVDAVQNELECCGDNSYEDWFRVPWLKLSMEGPEDAENGPRLEEQSMSEDREEESPAPVDVPFSCCSNNIPKPCVHHDILNPSAVYDYDPKHLTISTVGCRSKIVSRGEVVRTFLAGYLALLSVYQMVLSFMSRLLQTAHCNDYYIGPRKSRYRVWIFSRPKDLPETKDTLIPRKRKVRSSEGLASFSSDTSETEDTEVPTERRRNRANSMKLLGKIRSKILAARSKSFPLIQRSALFSKKRRKEKHRSKDQLKKDDENEEDERLLPKNLPKSEAILKEASQSTISLPANSSSTDLPPPPPPPPFVALDLEEKEEADPVAPFKSFRANLDTSMKSIVKNQNSGRRVKVLEKFDKIWERGNLEGTRRESGGADDSDSRRSSRSNCSKIRPRMSSADIYDRFRGSLQHTLARREAIQSQRRYIRDNNNRSNLDIKRSNLLTRLRCNAVPPCYRLLANVEVQRRPTSQTCSTPPPSPPPSPSSSDPSAKPNLSATRGTKTLKRRQCSICNRPVQQISDSSNESLADHDTRIFSKGMLCGVRKEAEEEHSREHYVARNRSTSFSNSRQWR
ncbi:uncharacterized protein LOC105663737 isoform X1 [Megachile rotundata]|uniref:uncharacterized protein LOC105663737 isoform X1 n=1 Tax=Megachile rotundata TaxID=143995 RepID=UPI003FCF76EF